MSESAKVNPSFVKRLLTERIRKGRYSDPKAILGPLPGAALAAPVAPVD
jgi:hypothetical protein